MSQTAHSSSPVMPAYEAVSAVLSTFGPHDVVSTGNTLQAVRWLEPGCPETDEELVALIVSIATGRTMGVSFDHKHRRAAA